MELTSEEVVTRLLSSKEILHINKKNVFASNPAYNLGKFIENIKNAPSPYGAKYVFIK